jgi:hypothetical protein
MIYDLNNIFLANKYKGGIFIAKYLHVSRIVINIILIVIFGKYLNPSD